MVWLGLWGRPIPPFCKSSLDRNQDSVRKSNTKKDSLPHHPKPYQAVNKPFRGSCPPISTSPKTGVDGGLTIAEFEAGLTFKTPPKIRDMHSKPCLFDVIFGILKSVTKTKMWHRLPIQSPTSDYPQQETKMEHVCWIWIISGIVFSGENGRCGDEKQKTEHPISFYQIDFCKGSNHPLYTLGCPLAQ